MRRGALIALALLAAYAVARFTVLAPKSENQSDVGPAPVAPAWAKVSVAQLASARAVKVPVAFEKAIGMRFVLIPPGTFLIGNPEGEERHQRDEMQPRVSISKAYYISVFETTNAQFKRFQSAHVISEKSTAADQPVVEVSHENATNFAAWLGPQDPAHAYRLPSEAQWECSMTR